MASTDALQASSRGSIPRRSTNSPRKALSYDEAADRVKTAIIWVIDAIG